MLSKFTHLSALDHSSEEHIMIKQKYLMEKKVDINEDYYQILRVPKNASRQEIRKQYLKLVKYYHPDANSEIKNNENIIKINEAWEVLGDNTQRYAYDLSIKNSKNVMASWQRDHSSKNMSAEEQIDKASKVEDLPFILREAKKSESLTLKALKKAQQLNINDNMIYEIFNAGKKSENTAMEALKLTSTTEGFEKVENLVMQGVQKKEIPEKIVFFIMLLAGQKSR